MNPAIGHETQTALHDRVVAEVAARMLGYIVHTNLGGRNVHLARPPHDVSPDIVLCDPEYEIADHIIEVEVEETVSPQQIERWFWDARVMRHRGTLWILVPESALETVRRACREHRIDARVGSWILDHNGFSLSWFPRGAVVTRTPARQTEEKKRASAVPSVTSSTTARATP